MLSQAFSGKGAKHAELKLNWITICSCFDFYFKTLELRTMTGENKTSPWIQSSLCRMIPVAPNTWTPASSPRSPRSPPTGAPRCCSPGWSRCPSLTATACSQCPPPAPQPRTTTAWTAGPTPSTGGTRPSPELTPTDIRWDTGPLEVRESDVADANKTQQIPK